MAPTELSQQYPKRNNVAGDRLLHVFLSID